MPHLGKIMLAALLSAGANLASAQSVTVTVGEPPFVMGAVESALAPITITENQPDALQDGYFTLAHFETPDNNLDFTATSSVSGSGTSIDFAERPGIGPGVIIHVDADDSRIDTITVQLYAVLQYFPVRNAHINLILGEDALLIPGGGAATGLGLTENILAGLFGGYCCVTIGDGSPTLELQVGESVTLPLTHDHPSFIEVDSFQPGIASIGTVTVNSVEIIGVMPGTALIQAWNPMGQSGYLTVTVAGPTASPQELLTLLIDEVEALVPDQLRPGQARALTEKLNAALRALERGNVNAACGQLNAFVHQVRARRLLNQAVADELAAAATAIMEELDCSCLRPGRGKRQ